MLDEHRLTSAPRRGRYLHRVVAAPHFCAPQMHPGAKVWWVGHSDGSQLAQLGALQLAAERGAGAIGGVVLFGPSRVGSRGFATFYNSLLGRKTVYYSYGESPGG
jgi:pimeloyl-ACP methyl ester carboxylesterase